MNATFRFFLFFISLLSASQTAIASATKFATHQYDVNHIALSEEIYGYDTNKNHRNCCQVPSDVNIQDRYFLAFASDFLATKRGRNLPFNDSDRLTEVNKTLDRIESKGPFPHKKDGTTFKNREGRLPEGNYREYTVDTPGARNRGARRVVQDTDSGRTYYTDDHYRNFTQIDPTKR